MILKERESFNSNFSDEKYEAFKRAISEHFNVVVPFRQAETPVFLPSDFITELRKAGEEIIDFISRDDFSTLSRPAIPAAGFVGGNEEKPLFLTFDFAVTLLDGKLTPRLIELQGFPSLYAYQNMLAKFFLAHFSIPADYTWLYDSLTPQAYERLLCDTILAGHSSDEVVLLDIKPLEQNTYVDFLATSETCHIAVVGLEEVLLEGKKLYYLRPDGEKRHIKRIYNRIIFDELVKRTDLKFNFHLTEDVEVEWAGHPNWFFRISKYLLPLIKSEYVPETAFLSDIGTYPKDLENYVLKPLYSFSGSGVEFHVTQAKLDLISDRSNYILQKKVEYAPVVAAPDGGVKTEIRLLYLWPPELARPKLVINLCRLSRGEMIGVKFNKDRTWVGSSVAFFKKR